VTKCPSIRLTKRLIFAFLDSQSIQGSATKKSEEPIIELATELRARFNLRTPDALHYATAVDCGARVFLTGDLAFARLTEIPVELL
jgi:predicted nucleic acid-binding protein